MPEPYDSGWYAEPMPPKPSRSSGWRSGHPAWSASSAGRVWSARVAVGRATVGVVPGGGAGGGALGFGVAVGADGVVDVVPGVPGPGVPGDVPPGLV